MRTRLFFSWAFILTAVLALAGCGPNSQANSTFRYFAYTANFITNSISAFSINATSGVLTPITGAFTTGFSPQSIVTVKTTSTH